MIMNKLHQKREKSIYLPDNAKLSKALVSQTLVSHVSHNIFLKSLTDRLNNINYGLTE